MRFLCRFRKIGLISRALLLVFACVLGCFGALSSSVSAVSVHAQTFADLFQVQQGYGVVIKNYDVTSGFNYFPIYTGERYDNVCFHYRDSYGSGLSYVETWTMSYSQYAQAWVYFSAPGGSALNYTDSVSIGVYNESGRIYYQYFITGTTISNQQTCYQMTLKNAGNGGNYVDVGFNTAKITTYDNAPSVSDLSGQLSSINGNLVALVTDSHALYQELQANRIATDNIRDAMITLAPDVSDIKDILEDLNVDLNGAIEEQTQQDKEFHDETKDTFDDAQTDADNDSASSSQQAESTGTTLLGAFIQLLGALTGAAATDCVINADIGDFHMGNVDLCELDPPPAFQVISSLMVIGFAVPLSVALGKKIISMFRSFQG